MWLWVFWWCVDDHLAELFGIPALGHVPFWVVFVLSLAFASTTTRNGEK